MQSAIIYWRINDFSAKGRGTPWLSIDAGRAALFDHLETSALRFPDINQLLGKVVVIVDRDSDKAKILHEEAVEFTK